MCSSRASAQLSEEADTDIQEQRDKDGDALNDLAETEGDQRGQQQQRGHQALHLIGKDLPGSALAVLCQLVAPMLAQPPAHLGGIETSLRIDPEFSDHVISGPGK